MTQLWQQQFAGTVSPKQPSTIWILKGRKKKTKQQLWTGHWDKNKISVTKVKGLTALSYSCLGRKEVPVKVKWTKVNPLLTRGNRNLWKRIIVVEGYRVTCVLYRCGERRSCSGAGPWLWYRHSRTRLFISQFRSPADVCWWTLCFAQISGDSSSTFLKSVNRRSIVGASAYYFSNVMLILLIYLVKLFSFE